MLYVHCRPVVRMKSRTFVYLENEERWVFSEEAVVKRCQLGRAMQQATQSRAPVASNSAVCLSTLRLIFAHLLNSSCADVLCSSLLPARISFFSAFCFLCRSDGRR